MDWRKYKRTFKHIRLFLILGIILVNLAAGVARPSFMGTFKRISTKEIDQFCQSLY